MLCCSKHQTSHSVILRDLHVCAAYLHLLHYTYHAIRNEECWTMSLLLAVRCAFVPSVAESWKSHWLIRNEEMWIWWTGSSVSEEYGMPTVYNEKRGWHSRTHSTYVHGPVGCRCTGQRVTRGKDVTTWLQLLTFPTSLFSTTEWEEDTVGTWPGLSTNGCLRRVPPPYQSTPWTAYHTSTH